jgi:hypothetical protein
LSKPKKLLVIFASITTILISCNIAYFAIGLVVSTRSVCTKDIIAGHKTIKISGTTSNSGEAFAGYNDTIKKDTLYLKLRYSIVNPIHHSGDFNIILDNNIGNVKYIYLQGNKIDDKKLVWSK